MPAFPHRPTARRRPHHRAARLLAVALLLATALGLDGAASPRGADARALGGGRYLLTATVYGGGDGLVGNATTSGRILKPLDRVIALPACTESSCPWVPVGTGPGARWGPQTDCAEADGLCWVEVRSDETGLCAVAPVLDLGPLFVEDNWWAPLSQRTYRFGRGFPAAIVSAQGRDLGYGPGISDVGNNIARDYSYAAAIDLAAGTWVDLGLDPYIGIAQIRVKLLWQAGISHYEACGGAYGNASVVDAVNLRAGPSTREEIISVISAGGRVSVTGGNRNGFYLVDVDGLRGWVSGDYLRLDGGGTGDPLGFVRDQVNLRAGPSTADGVIRSVPEGNMVVLRGGQRNGFYPVRHRGTNGWISATYVDAGASSGSSGGGAVAIATDDLNLRSGPGTNRSVRRVIPAGSEITLTGRESRGYLSVRYDGTSGWVRSAYVSIRIGSGTRTATTDVNLRRGPSTADGVIRVVPEGGRVRVVGSQANGFLRVRYGGSTGWVFAAYLN